MTIEEYIDTTDPITNDVLNLFGTKENDDPDLVEEEDEYEDCF